MKPSGVDVAISHIWSKKGEYLIKAYAQDQFGSNSPESSKSINIPRNRALFNTQYSILFWLFERFPIIKHLLKI